MATSGPLRAGPFFDVGPAGTGERKLWVASDRDGRDDARLTVVDPNGETSAQVRKSGVAFVETAAQFYPGIVAVTVPGTYRIEIAVGQDRMCVTVHYA